MTDFNTWLNHQRNIERKATKSGWVYSEVIDRDDITRTGISGIDIHDEVDGEILAEMKLCSWPRDWHEDAKFICESRNNYRNMLDALEIAMNGLEHFCDCVSPYAGACGNCTATIKIKQKLGVTE